MNAFELLAADFEERYGSQPSGKLAIIRAALRTREFTAVFLYRMHVTLERRRKIIPGIRALLYHVLRSSFGIDIHPNADIGPGLVIHHSHSIVIGDGVKVGSRFHVYHSVTIGARNQFDLSRYPIIGNNVTVYTGSVIAGNLNIGDDVVIGANALVLHDVPDGSVVFSPAAQSKPR